MSCSWVQGWCFLVIVLKPLKNSVVFFIFSVPIFISAFFFKNQKKNKLFWQHWNTFETSACLCTTCIYFNSLYYNIKIKNFIAYYKQLVVFSKDAIRDIIRKVLAGIMNISTARCWSSDTYNPCPGK